MHRDMNCEKKTYLAVFLSARNSDKSAHIFFTRSVSICQFFCEKKQLSIILD